MFYQSGWTDTYITSILVAAAKSRALELENATRRVRSLHGSDLWENFSMGVVPALVPAVHLHMARCSPRMTHSTRDTTVKAHSAFASTRVASIFNRCLCDPRTSPSLDPSLHWVSVCQCWLLSCAVILLRRCRACKCQSCSQRCHCIYCMWQYVCARQSMTLCD